MALAEVKIGKVDTGEEEKGVFIIGGKLVLGLEIIRQRLYEGS